MKKLAVLAAALLIVLNMTACKSRDELTYVADVLDIELAGSKLLQSEDTHGGFHNDGLKFIVLECGDDTKKNILKAFENGKNWLSLPLTDEISEVISGITDSNLKPLIPEIENGWYFFTDRQNKEMKTRPLSQRYSCNFTLAVLDSDAEKLYFIEFDT